MENIPSTPLKVVNDSARPFSTKFVVGLTAVVLIGGAALFMTSVAQEEVPATEPTPQTNEQPVENVDMQQDVEVVPTREEGTTSTAPVVDASLRQNGASPSATPVPASTTPTPVTPTTPAVPVVTKPEPVIPQKKYVDGTYSATGGYFSPAGQEQVTVTLVLKDDVVTSATFVGGATHATSKKMQGMFAAGFNEKVVGKSIDSVSLSVVNGSSLTPKGFMDAVAKIKAEAKA